MAPRSAEKSRLALDRAATRRDTRSIARLVPGLFIATERVLIRKPGQDGLALAGHLRSIVNRAWSHRRGRGRRPRGPRRRSPVPRAAHMGTGKSVGMIGLSARLNQIRPDVTADEIAYRQQRIASCRPMTFPVV